MYELKVLKTAQIEEENIQDKRYEVGGVVLKV